MTRLLTTLTICGLLLGAVSTAAAQETVPTRSSGTRIALQARLDAFNLFGVQDSVLVDDADTTIPGAFVPLVTPGVRLMDGRLFLGVGFGFYGISQTECGGDGCDDDETTFSTSGWSVNPLASFDILADDFGALHLVGWLNFADLGGATIERRTPGMTDTRDIDGLFWWGLNLGAGVRGKLSEGAALGAELGWGFATSSDDGDEPGDADDTDLFVHGIFGILLFEGSVGL